MIESFLKHLEFEKRVSKHTIVAYKTDLLAVQQFLLKEYGEEDPSKSTYSMLRNWLVALVESGVKPQSVNRKIATLRSFFKFLMRENAIAKDPTVKINVLKTSKRLPVFVKEKEISEIINNTGLSDHDETEFQRMRSALVIELLYGTGIRLSELINLKITDIDMHGRVIKVLGKRNKERVIPFPDEVHRAIVCYLNTRQRDIDASDEKVLLVTDAGKKCYPVLIQRIVKKMLASASADKKSPHVLRHTYATHLLDQGAEINAVKDLLGHASLAATQVYTHNSMEKLKKVFQQAHPKA